MIKTLYTRVVLAFIMVTIFSLLVATLIGLTLFKQTINKQGQTDMLAAGRTIQQLIDEQKPTEINVFFQQMAELTTYPLHLYEQEKKVTFYSLDNNNRTSISSNAVTAVLKGESYRSSARLEETYSGMPLMINKRPYALFLQYSYENENIINFLLFFILTLVLLIGSLCILVAARYLVKPLRELKQATEQIATGNFDVNLNLNRTDEVGELAQSFDKMTVQLKQIEQMRQDFVSNVSHEIQSPLTSISGFARALKNEKLITAEKRPYYLTIIIDESDRLSRLGDNLLKLASLDSEHHPFEVKSFDLIEQARQVIVATETQWTAKELSVELTETPPINIIADRDLLQQVWLNLLSNSIKFTPPKGRITISFETNNQQVTIYFADTGIGIPKTELKTIFQRFYKTDKSHNRQREGNGLGLAIVKKIITLHHGDISVHSRLDVGTTFTINLPLTNK